MVQHGVRHGYPTMHALARCSRVLYDHEMLENAREVARLRARARPVYTEQYLQAACELQWVQFHRRYTRPMHYEIMSAQTWRYMDLPSCLFDPVIEVSMYGVVAGVNAFFLAAKNRYCWSELMQQLEQPFKRICLSCWLDAVDVRAEPYTPLTTFFVREHAHLSVEEILEKVLKQ